MAGTATAWTAVGGDRAIDAEEAAAVVTGRRAAAVVACRRLWKRLDGDRSNRRYSGSSAATLGCARPSFGSLGTLAAVGDGARPRLLLPPPLLRPIAGRGRCPMTTTTTTCPTMRMMVYSMLVHRRTSLLGC